MSSSSFFFTDAPPPEMYTLSLHDALPIFRSGHYEVRYKASHDWPLAFTTVVNASGDRKSTRLNSSHVSISYAVFCLKKKKSLTATDHGLADHTSAAFGALSDPGSCPA